MAPLCISPYLAHTCRRKNIRRPTRASVRRPRGEQETESVLVVVRCPICRFPLVPRMSWRGPSFFCRCAGHRFEVRGRSTNPTTAAADAQVGSGACQQLPEPALV
jgi:hypothetical protein